MIVTREEFQIQSEFYSLDYNVPRSLGCHLSDVIKYMRLGPNDKQYADKSDAETEATFFGGYVWEHVMAQHVIDIELQRNRHGLVRLGQLFWCYQCREVIVGRKPAELHCKRFSHFGIFATPDGIVVGGWTLKEWKFTKFSLRYAGADCMHDGADEHPRYEHIAMGFPHWVMQVKCYCWLLGQAYMRPMLRAVIEANFVEGDYGITTRSAKTVRYRFAFGEEELDEAWQTTVANAEDGGMLKAA